MKRLNREVTAEWIYERAADKDKLMIMRNDYSPNQLKGLASRLDRWVLRNALSWLQDAQPRVGNATFGINLSGESVGNTGFVTEVLQQDADNVAINQRGLNSDGFRGMYLGEQELRLRHFHQVLDQYLSDDDADRAG